MDPGEGVDFKTLRSKFQNPQALNIRTKPTIPEKPKSLTSPTTKISNPLIATINSAMENRMPPAPRVVFKDEKKSPVKRLFSQSDTVELKKDIHPELLDKKQKKEGDLIKQALKDKKLPLVLPVSPVTPVIQETPKPDPVPASPALASPVKISTPKEKSVFNFKKTVEAEEQKTDRETSERDLPATPVFQSEPVAPKSVIPQVQAEAALASISPAPVIPDPVISPRVVPVSEVPIPTVREPDIVSQISPHLENSKPEILVTNRNPQPDVYLPVEVANSPEIPDILDINIPPPLIPEDIADADIPDADISALNIPPPVTPDSSISSVASEVSNSPDLSRSASPAPAASASVTPEPSGTSVPATVIPNSDAAPASSTPPRMPSPAPDVNPRQENGKAEFHEVVGQTENTPAVVSTSSKNMSALSALARAEEMAPVRHNHCDQRLLNLLEKAKRKHAVNHQMPTPLTPEIMTSVETAPPAVAPPESSVPEKPQAEEAQAEPVLSVEASLGPETPVALAPLLDIPPVDYESRAREASTVHSKPPTSKTALTNGLDQRDALPVPKVRPEQIPTKMKTAPPPPPRRTTLPSGSSLSVAPEKPPRAISVDLQTILPAQPVEANENIIPAPVDFVSQNSMFDDSEVDGSSVEPPQASVSEYGNPILSVHEQAFLEQLSPEHHSSTEFVPNVETTGADFKLEKAAGPPDSAPDSPVIPSPSGMPEINYNSSDNVHEDPAANKKSKTLKKQHKGVLMNPYVDSPAANEEISRKTLFAKKTASLDDKELKKKEKQKEKEKEKEKREQKEKEKEHKEKEKEKKEHKDKEKKEHKDKEKEKEHKEKEKEKKELKDKEKEKKEQKEKEREKKEQKEKEREKREQKEKEKKENEMKKKFKITGEEEALYQTKVRETCKARKDDLAVKAGETVSIIRTTHCPKGKWLARDSNNKYGYILVKSVDLDIQEMMELGKRAKTSSTPKSNGFIDPEVTSAGSRSSHPYALHQESFTVDSEEWCDDDDDTVFTPTDNIDRQLNQRVSSLDVVSQEPNPALQGQINTNDKTRQEALQKLASFFAQPKAPDHATLKRNTIIEEAEPEESVSEDKQDVDLQILPPPDLYADIVVGES
ncbi:hypothetical protein SRHO_G00068870 [Serrasalmus rhombeus]